MARVWSEERIGASPERRKVVTAFYVASQFWLVGRVVARCVVEENTYIASLGNAGAAPPWLIYYDTLQLPCSLTSPITAPAVLHCLGTGESSCRKMDPRRRVPPAPAPLSAFRRSHSPMPVVAGTLPSAFSPGGGLRGGGVFGSASSSSSGGWRSSTLGGGPGTGVGSRRMYALVAGLVMLLIPMAVMSTRFLRDRRQRGAFSIALGKAADNVRAGLDSSQLFSGWAVGPGEDGAATDPRKLRGDGLLNSLREGDGGKRQQHQPASPNAEDPNSNAETTAEKEGDAASEGEEVEEEEPDEEGGAEVSEHREHHHAGEGELTGTLADHNHHGTISTADLELRGEFVIEETEHDFHHHSDAAEEEGKEEEAPPGAAGGDGEGGGAADVSGSDVVAATAAGVAGEGEQTGIDGTDTVAAAPSIIEGEGAPSIEGGGAPSIEGGSEAVGEEKPAEEAHGDPEGAAGEGNPDIPAAVEEAAPAPSDVTAPAPFSMRSALAGLPLGDRVKIAQLARAAAVALARKSGGAGGSFTGDEGPSGSISLPEQRPSPSPGRVPRHPVLFHAWGKKQQQQARKNSSGGDGGWGVGGGSYVDAAPTPAPGSAALPEWCATKWSHEWLRDLMRSRKETCVPNMKALGE